MIEPIVGLATPVAIIAIVNLLKRLGVNGMWSTVAAVVLGIGITLAETYMPGELYQTFARGVLLSLSASGLYDLRQGQAGAVTELSTFEEPEIQPMSVIVEKGETRIQ